MPRSRRVSGRSKVTIAVILAVLSVIAIQGLPYLFVMPGESWPLSVSIDRTLTAHVTLDAAHPSAVQAFSTIAGGWPFPPSIYGLVRADADRQPLRVTVLADDGGSIAVRYPVDSKMAVFGADDGRGAMRPGRYLALVELIDPLPAVSAEVNLSVEMDATFRSPRTPGPDPSALDVRLDAIGGFTTRSARVVSATYRETISGNAGPTNRSLVLTLSGAARPVALGGNSHVILTLRPESYDVPESQLMSVSGHLTPPSGPFTWRLPGAGASNSQTYPVGGDPSVQCSPSLDGCESGIALGLDSVECGSLGGTSSQTPRPSSCTFVLELEVRAILLDVTALPAGAAVTLELMAGGPSPTTDASPPGSASPSPEGNAT